MEAYSGEDVIIHSDQIDMADVAALTHRERSTGSEQRNLELSRSWIHFIFKPGETSWPCEVPSLWEQR